MNGLLLVCYNSVAPHFDWRCIQCNRQTVWWGFLPPMPFYMECSFCNVNAVCRWLPVATAATHRPVIAAVPGQSTSASKVTAALSCASSSSVSSPTAAGNDGSPLPDLWASLPSSWVDGFDVGLADATEGAMNTPSDLTSAIRPSTFQYVPRTELITEDDETLPPSVVANAMGAGALVCSSAPTAVVGFSNFGVGI